MNNKNHHSAVSATLKKNILVVTGVALLMGGQLQGDGGLMQRWFSATPEDEEELTAQWGEAVQGGNTSAMKKILRKARTPEERLRIINSPDEMDETALISAVRQGRTDTVVLSLI